MAPPAVMVPGSGKFDTEGRPTIDNNALIEGFYCVLPHAYPPITAVWAHVGIPHLWAMAFFYCRCHGVPHRTLCMWAMTAVKAPKYCRSSCSL